MRPFIIGALVALACYTAGYLVAARKWKTHGERSRERMIETTHRLRVQLDNANAREITAMRDRVLARMSSTERLIPVFPADHDPGAPGDPTHACNCTHCKPDADA